MGKVKPICAQFQYFMAQNWILCSGVLVHQNIRTSEHQNIRTSEHQNIRTSEQQNIRTSEHQITKTQHDHQKKN